MKITPLNKSQVKMLLVIGLVFALYTCNLARDYDKDFINDFYRNTLTSFDAIPNTFLAYNLLTYGSLDFNAIDDLVIQTFGDDYFFMENYKGQVVSVYPIIPGLAALPVFVIPMLLHKIPTLIYETDVLKVLVLARLTASFIAALSVGMMYATLTKLKVSDKKALLFTFFYAFGTTTWAISSRSLWQHTTSQLILSGIVYLMLFKNKPVVVGLLTGLLVVNRPLMAIVAVFLLLYYVFHKRSQVLKFIGGGIPFILFIVIYNTIVFGGPLIEGYGARGDLNWSTPLSESLLGFAFSPARSLLFISPLLLVFIPKLIELIKSKKEKELLWLGLGSVAYFLVMCKWYAWDGANGFGYRMLTDLLPIWGLLAFIKLAEVKNKLGYTLIVVLTVYSIVIQANAVFNLKSRCHHDNNWNFKCLPTITRT